MGKTATPEHSLGSTARWTAGVRAKESKREDRLFNDPWAAALAGKEGEEWVEHRLADNLIPIVLRTRFFNDFLKCITFQKAIRQVVLMAAGLDTRAFRLSWPDQTQVFELDRPSVLKYKEQILHSTDARSSCARHMVEVDLIDPWRDALIRSDFNLQHPSGWLLEGFLFYFSNENLTHLLDEVASLAVPGSWIGFDIINSTMLTSPWTQHWVKMQADFGAPWIGTMDDPEGFLARRGWKATVTQAGAKDANHGRWPYPVIPTMMPDMPHNWFVIAEKSG